MRFDDFQNGTLHINKTMQRVQCLGEDTKTKVIITQPKTHSSDRIIPLPEFINSIIKDMYISDAFLLTGTNKYTEPRTFENRFKALLKQCGLPETNVHACRHTFATICVETGCEIKALSEILGHSSVNITLNRYVHPTIAVKRKVIESISFLAKNATSNN